MPPPLILVSFDEASDAAAANVVTHERHTNGKKAALHLSIDAPNPATGTGSKLILDGHDAALLRCALDFAGSGLSDGEYVSLGCFEVR